MIFWRFNWTFWTFKKYQQHQCIRIFHSFTKIPISSTLLKQVKLFRIFLLMYRRTPLMEVTPVQAKPKLSVKLSDSPESTSCLGNHPTLHWHSDHCCDLLSSSLGAQQTQKFKNGSCWAVLGFKINRRLPFSVGDIESNTLHWSWRMWSPGFELPGTGPHLTVIRDRRWHMAPTSFSLIPSGCTQSFPFFIIFWGDGEDR